MCGGRSKARLDSAPSAATVLKRGLLRLAAVFPTHAATVFISILKGLTQLGRYSNLLPSCYASSGTFQSSLVDRRRVAEVDLIITRNGTFRHVGIVTSLQRGMAVNSLLSSKSIHINAFALRRCQNVVAWFSRGKSVNPPRDASFSITHFGRIQKR